MATSNQYVLGATPVLVAVGPGTFYVSANTGGIFFGGDVGVTIATGANLSLGFGNGTTSPVVIHLGRNETLFAVAQTPPAIVYVLTV